MLLESFVGGSYPSQSKNANLQRTINLVPTITGTPDARGKVPMMLVGAPGLELWLALGSLPIRGMHVIDDALYAVVGQEVYKILNNLTKSTIGQLETNNGRVWMEHNNNSELGIVDGKKLYVYNTGTAVFAQPNPQPVGAPTSLAFIDQYFVVSLSESMFFAISDVNDAMTWDPAQIAAAEATPDKLRVVWNLHRQLYLLGSQTTEVWFDAGTVPFPFESTSGVIDWGVVAPDSVAQAADTLVWLGVHKDGGLGGRVVAASGLQATPISTPGLEARWRTYPTVVDAFAFTYQFDGNDCYALTFPSGNETFVYDFSTQAWHERSSYPQDAWIASHTVKFVSKQLVGDRTTGNLYSMSPEHTEENSLPIVGRRISPHTWNERKRFTVHALEVEFETGVLVSGLEPLAKLRWSKDGGHNWSGWVEVSLGKTGERLRRAIWRRIGLARDIVFELEIANDNKVAILGASAEMSAGDS